MGKAGSPVCRYVDYKCYMYIWLDSEELYRGKVKTLKRESVTDHHEQ